MTAKKSAMIQIINITFLPSCLRDKKTHKKHKVH